MRQTPKRSRRQSGAWREINPYEKQKQWRMMMKAKVITAAVLGAATLGLSQSAVAGWQSGACSSTSSSPCIELNQTNSPSPAYFTAADPDAAQSHGYPGTNNPFVFSGETHLVCDGVAVDCTLALDGYVNIHGSPDKVGIKVVNATVTGGALSLCGLVTVDGFPWYIAGNTYHGPYGALPLGVPATGPYIGSIGPIGVEVPFPVSKDFSNGHMHDVTYNNVDTFSFGTNGNDPVIWLNDDPNNPNDGSFDYGSGCTVSGNLTLQSPGISLTIHP